MSFTSIPATYRYLWLRVVGRSIVNASQYAQLKLNNDGTAGNYFYEMLTASNTTIAGQQSIGATNAFIQVGVVPGADSDSTDTNVVSATDILIYEYSKTDIYKPVSASGAGVWAMTSGNLIAFNTSGLYKSASAITQLDIIPSGASAGWSTKSRGTLYGVMG